MTSDFPVWAEWLQTLAVPAIAMAGVSIAFSSYRLAKTKRRDDLFDRRYALFKEAQRIWLTTYGAKESGDSLDYQGDELKSLAYEARFIFSQEVADHLVGLVGKEHRGDFEIPSKDFVEPFMPFLALGK